MIDGLTITQVHETPTLLQVFGTVAGEPFEFTAFRGGAFELYDFSTYGDGTPHFQRYLPAEQGEQIVTALRCGGWLRPTGGYPYVLRGGMDEGRMAALDLSAVPAVPVDLPEPWAGRFLELNR